MASTLPDDAVLALYSLVTRELEQSSSEDRHLSADNDDALNCAARRFVC